MRYWGGPKDGEDIPDVSEQFGPRYILLDGEAGRYEFTLATARYEWRATEVSA